jgi:uncharacterized protein
MNTRRISRVVISILALLVLLYVLLCIALLVFQRSFIYFPQPRALDDPATLLKLPGPEAELLVTSRPHEGPNALIYFGGNGEDVSQNLPDFSQAFADHALYLLHYRGYGGSAGEPTEEALQRDALALFDWVHARHPCTAVVGRSLGSGVAIRLATQRPVSHLVLVTPYNSIEELAMSQFPFAPIKWMLQDKFESWKYAPDVTAPTLLIAAADDQVIPRSSTEALYSRFTEGLAALEIVPAVGHNSLSANPAYLRLLKGGVCKG